MRHSGNFYLSNQTWYAKDNPHIVTGNVRALQSKILTIEAGCKVYFNSGTKIILGYNSTNKGSLIAEGTIQNPILFTANSASPTKGFWSKLHPAFINSFTLKNVIIEYAQYGVDADGTGTYNISDVEIRQCSINGLYVRSSTTGISNLIIHDCNGAGIKLGYTATVITTTIKNCLLYDCGLSSGCGGITCWKGTHTIENCTIDNCGGSGDFKGSIWGWSGAGVSIVIKNCIVTNGSAKGIDLNNKGSISYTNSWNNSSSNFANYSDGGGNTQVDPKYVGGGDYHLQSTKGSYHAGGWDADANDSPCIDTGHPSSDYSNEHYYNGGVINKGKYGNTIEASRSSDTYYIKAGTSKVDWDAGTKSDVDSAISEGDLVILSEIATETIIQDTGTTETNCEVYGVNDIGQQFKTTKRRLNKISVYGKKVGTPPNNCILKIWYVDEGDVYKIPTLLATVSKSPDDFGTSLAYIDFTLSPEIDLPAQTNLIFTLEMESDGEETGSSYVFARSDSSQYANGNMIYSTDNWVTTNDYATYDLRFKISEADIKSSGTWTKDYDGGSSASWQKIYFESSGVKFRFKSATTQGGLDGATWTGYVTTSGSNISVSSNRWLRVEATLEL